MNIFSQLRALVLLRRGVRALESIAESQETLARIAQDEWEAAHAPRQPKPTEFGVLDLTEVSKRYRAERAERGEDVFDDEESNA